MSEQYVPNLGHEPAEGARRDAIHVPVAPVVAGQLLKPGEHVGFGDDGLMYRWGGLVVRISKTIGVVDPYRESDVQQGGRFWLLLYQGTVTSLRHVWSHSAFAPKLPERKDH